MIFPATILDISNKDLYSDMKGYQHHMLTLGMSELVCNYVQTFCHDNEIEQDILFEDLPLIDNLYILVTDKTIYNILDDVLPELFINGFVYVSSPFAKNDNGIGFCHSDYLTEITDRIKEKKKMKIDCVSKTIHDFQFLPILYKEILPLNIPCAYRYLLMYQVVEYLMDKKRNEILIQSISSYDHINRGDLRETIQSTFKEEQLIRRIYANINTTQDFYSNFIDVAKELFRFIGKDYSEDDNFCDFMYGVRNVIVHNYKEATNFPELIKKLTEYYELALVDLMKKVNIRESDNKRLFVINKNASYKENKHRLYDAYHN